jgi:hypothetical protein
MCAIRQRRAAAVGRTRVPRCNCHSRDPIAREEGHAPPARRQRGRGDSGPVGAASPAVRSGRTRSITSPTAKRTLRPRPKRSGTRLTAKSMALPAPSAPAGPLEAFRWGSRPGERTSRLHLPILRGAALYGCYTTGELKAVGSFITT